MARNDPTAREPRGVYAAEVRRPFTFVLDDRLVHRARSEVGEPEVVRSIEAALLAAIDYKLWVREVEGGARRATD